MENKIVGLTQQDTPIHKALEEQCINRLESKGGAEFCIQK